MSPLDTILNPPAPRSSCGQSLEPSLTDAIVAQATVRDDAVAVASPDLAITYHDLKERSGRLAEELVGLGIGPEHLVALCLGRSPAFIVSALATWRAGGAYLPLDPTFPEKRLAFLLKDSGADVLIVDEMTPFGWAENCRVVTLNQLGEMRQVPPGNRGTTQPRPSSAEHLAYVIYTSGSTGEPKGVEISHAALANLIQWHQGAFGVTANDRASQLARVGFDAAVWETWPYLSAGASLYLPQEELLNDPEALRDWLVAQKITISFAPTPLAERLIALPWPQQTALRIMLTGGDVLHSFPPADLPFALVNNYGPTECTVVATSSVVPPQQAMDRLPPIGKPIANTEIQILDQLQRPVAAGTPGELYLGGVSVARGYRRRADLTHEKFLPDPVTGEVTRRFFRTGDLVQRLPDGQLAFLGRLDDQIKIRGFRIEPDEIVAAINRHPLISQSAVVAREANSGDQRLVAYIVPKSQLIPTLSDLRQFLIERLPDFMVPAAFVALHALPLSRNGKVDRAALPIPDETNILPEDDFVAPTSEIEVAVSEILAPLLGMKKVGVNANFFALGGNSLLGTQLITRIRDTFGLDLPLRTIFESPTISELAAEIERELVAKLEAMSEEEAQQLLQSTAGNYSGTFTP